MPKKGEIKDRIGEKWLSCENCWMTIIAYRGALDCDVQFEDHTIVYNRYYDDIKKGYIRNPMYKSVYSTGYLGKGIHLPSLNRKTTKEYVTWQSMMERCYSKRRSSYKEVTVCEEWHNFQNFAEWFEENWKPWMDKNWHLDKDVLKKGNKTYSSENCIFVPRDINMFFIKQIKTRGDCPIGVRKSGNKFRAECNIEGKLKYLGTFKTPEEAFQAYKIAKEEYIKEVADKWKDQITEKVYEAMYNYVVEITD